MTLPQKEATMRPKTLMQGLPLSPSMSTKRQKFALRQRGSEQGHVHLQTQVHQSVKFSPGMTSGS